jgi:hypothetical protein
MCQRDDGTLKASFINRRAAFPANEGSGDVVETHLVRRTVGSVAGSSFEPESLGLKVDLVGIHRDLCTGFQDHRCEMGRRNPASDICRGPSGDICARTTCFSNLEALVGFPNRDDAIEKMQDVVKATGAVGIGGLGTVAVDSTFSIGVTAGGCGTVCLAGIYSEGVVELRQAMRTRAALLMRETDA